MKEKTNGYDESDQSNTSDSRVRFETEPRREVGAPIRRFSERLKEVVGDASLRGFARHCGLSEGVMRSYIRGDTLPTLDRLDAISVSGGVNAGWLATGEGEKFRPRTVTGALLVEERGSRSLKEMAAKLGITVEQLERYEQGLERPSNEFLKQFSLFTNDNPVNLPSKLNVSVAGTVDELKAEVPSNTVSGQSAAYSPDDYVALPLYDVRAAAGSGAMVDVEQAVDFLHFKRSWVRNELRCSPGDLYLIYVDGESMEPTLRPGDVILVDHRDQSQARDGIYVLRLNGTLLVKRLQRLPGGIIKVTSDNRAYQPFEVTALDLGQDFAIIGRVVWSGRRM